MYIIRKSKSTHLAQKGLGTRLLKPCMNQNRDYSISLLYVIGFEKGATSRRNSIISIIVQSFKNVISIVLLHFRTSKAHNSGMETQLSVT